MLLFTDFLLRIGSAFVMGTLIGLERQYRQRDAGLRTNVLVTVGSAAFTVLSYAMTSGNGDPSRVAAQIVSGIGFLGGGLIQKDGFNVKGLNTAATIWCSAASGTLVGVGMFAESAILVGFVLLTHLLYRPLCRLIERNSAESCAYSLRVECRTDLVDKIREIIMRTLSFGGGVKLSSLYYKNMEDKSVVCCDLEIVGGNRALLDLLVARVRAVPEVSFAGWEERHSSQEDF